MGWLKKIGKKIKKGVKKVAGVHKIAVGALFGSKKLISSGIKQTGLSKGGKGGGAKQGRERYKRRKRNPWKSKRQKAFESTSTRKKGGRATSVAKKLVSTGVRSKPKNTYNKPDINKLTGVAKRAAGRLR